jgi:hypothetical protein
MSARFVGNIVGMSTEWVYGMWKDMGLVVKDKFGDWTLTEMGRNIGGRMSNGVPTFDFDIIEQMMVDFYDEHRK